MSACYFSGYGYNHRHWGKEVVVDESADEVGMRREKAFLQLIHESGLLKRVRRSGWWVVGINNPESVAEHCFRCAVIGYVLAVMERLDAHTVTMMCLLNDIQEARINDAHKVASRYLNFSAAEDAAFADQTARLPEPARRQLRAWRADYTAQKTPESIAARDADILECLIQAKEYHEQGYAQAEKFLRKAPRFLRSAAAKQLWQAALRTDSSGWWQELTDFKR
ncbi:MAG: HD domain-containing protein [Candidatus Omnitrophica bacterium]|nr:HD domain-containing protein [Candidatus Omnitrophota bacterium]